MSRGAGDIGRLFGTAQGEANHKPASVRGLHADEVPGEGDLATERVPGRRLLGKLRVQADRGGKAHTAAGHDPAPLPRGAVWAGGSAGGADPLRYGAAARAIGAGRGADGRLSKWDL